MFFVVSGGCHPALWCERYNLAGRCPNSCFIACRCEKAPLSVRVWFLSPHEPGGREGPPHASRSVAASRRPGVHGRAPRSFRKVQIDLDMPATPPRGASETSLLPLCPGQQGMWQGKSAWMSVSQDEGAGAPPHRHTHELPPPGDGLRPSTHIPSGPSPREEL